MAGNEQESRLEGSVERVTFHSPESGFCVLRIKARGFTDLVTLTGTLSSVHPGEWLSAQGTWRVDPKYGRQFQGREIHISPPGSLEGMRQYLASGMIHGIGKAMAERLVKAFGEAVFSVIEEEPSRLEEVEGIGPKRSSRIVAAWQEQKQVRHIMVFLHSHGVGTSRAFRIYRTYGDGAIEKIQENPYSLARDIWGIGFSTADKVAESLGIPKDSPLRAAAGVEFVLQELTGQGHCAFPREDLEERAAQLLEIPREIVHRAVEANLREERLREQEDPREDGGPSPLVALPSLDESEKRLALHLRALLEAPGAPLPGNWEKALAWGEQQHSLTLGESQREALLKTLKHHLCIITGGPGVGKTTIIRILCTIFHAAKKRICLAAPTGRAAKRMAEATGHEAKTLHRLLEFDPRTMRFQRNRQNPLEAEVFIVDEASMIDLVLAWQFVQAVPRGSALVLVGDADQLPSVGPGKVLRDCIASEIIPVARLDIIYRQAAQSAIVTNAHRINQGQYPRYPSGKNASEKLSDFYFVEASEPPRGVELILRMMADRIPRRFGLDPRKDLQVLAPMMRGELGVTHLNQRIQELLNPSGREVRRFGSTFREGDKVLQVVNNYDKDVFNGDMGFIENISPEDQEITVRFDQRRVLYPFSELDELILSYAISIHKSQGSEYPGVIIPVHTQHYMLLQRNLLYTGITRGKKLVILVGTPRALHLCLNRVESRHRVTTLKERLRRSGENPENR